MIEIFGFEPFVLSHMTYLQNHTVISVYNERSVYGYRDMPWNEFNRN